MQENANMDLIKNINGVRSVKIIVNNNGVCNLWSQGLPCNPSNEFIFTIGMVVGMVIMYFVIIPLVNKYVKDEN